MTGRPGAPWLVVTDLDGCLLHAETYAWEAHRPVLAELRRRGVPLALCTSKTRAEVEALRAAMGHDGPYVVEGGGAVHLPGGEVRVLGVPYARLREAFAELRRTLPVRGFGDMTDAEVAAAAGLPLAGARLARTREYDEPFTCEGDPEPAVRSLGLRCTRGGRFWHLHGDFDKGRAVRVLREALGPARVLGIGDSRHDLPMLREADVPVAIAKPDGRWDEALTAGLPGLRLHADWSRAVREIVLEPPAGTPPFT